MIIFEIQKELEHGLKPVNAIATENDAKIFEKLKNEYLSLSKLLINQLKSKVLIFILLNAVKHNELIFAKKLITDFDYLAFNRDGAKLALARFNFACKAYKKAENLFLELYEKNSLVDIRDYESLYISSNEIANFKNCELIIKKSLELFPETLMWKLYAVSYKINISHLYNISHEEIKNNLDYLAKRVNNIDELFLLATSYYMSGYFDLAMYYFNKVFEGIQSKQNIEKNKEYFNINECYDSMISIIQILRDNGYQPFLAFGTLLGLIREGKILEHDKDADLGIFVSGYDEVYKIVSTLCKFEHFTAPGIIKNTKDNNSLNIAIFDHKRGVSVDLFFFYKSSSDESYYSGIGTKCGNLLWEFSEFHLIKKEINNYHFDIPMNFEVHLSELYGDWGKTVKVWDSLVNCPNLSNTSKKAIYFFGLQRLYKAINESKYNKIKNYYQTLKNNWDFKFTDKACINIESLIKN